MEVHILCCKNVIDLFPHFYILLRKAFLLQDYG